MRLPQWRVLVVANPFAVVGLVSLALLVLGAMPAGADYDPDPFRTRVRAIADPLGFPFIVAGAATQSLGLTSPLATPVWFVLGLMPYLALDGLWRALRRRASRKPANEEL